ncbi:MAG: HAMP domain-containing sensor histidine kinase [Minicystis sp.]
MKRSGKRAVALLIAAVAVMTMGLAGLIAIVAHSSERLATVDTLVVGDTAPSIVALEAMTVDLGELDALVHERLSGSVERALVDPEIAAKRAALARDLERYLALPVDPGETQVRTKLQQASAALDRVLNQVLDHPASPELSAAWTEGVNHLDGLLLDAVAINTDIEERAVASLRSVRRMFLPSAVILQGLCIAAAAVVVGLGFQVLRDTARATAANRRLLEEKTNELEAFTGRVAHDLMSPLMSVSMALAAAEPCLDAPERERVRRMVARASASLQRVRSMVADLLDFARAGAAPPPNAEADAGEVSRGVAEDLAPFAEGARADLRVEIDTRRRVQCSAGALTSVLANLVQNAVKHLDMSVTRRVTLRAYDDGADICFEVEDTGPGIAAAEHARIFQPYARSSSNTPGLGLGLATVKRITEGHGGQVGIRSEPGRGALFWVRLPAIRAAAPPASGANDARQAS